MDLSKLSPPGWRARRFEGMDDDSPVSPAMTVVDWEFCCLARAAFDVMQRRGWYPRYVPPMYSEALGLNSPGFWRVSHESVGCFAFKDSPPHGNWPDPFTALVEADERFRAARELRVGHHSLVTIRWGRSDALSKAKGGVS